MFFVVDAYQEGEYSCLKQCSYFESPSSFLAVKASWSRMFTTQTKNNSSEKETGAISEYNISMFKVESHLVSQKLKLQKVHGLLYLLPMRSEQCGVLYSYYGPKWFTFCREQYHFEVPDGQSCPKNIEPEGKRYF